LGDQRLELLPEILDLGGVVASVAAGLLFQGVEGFAERRRRFVKPREPPQLLFERRDERVRLVQGEEPGHETYQGRDAP
jgi:hypothetical protein